MSTTSASTSRSEPHRPELTVTGQETYDKLGHSVRHTLRDLSERLPAQVVMPQSIADRMELDPADPRAYPEQIRVGYQTAYASQDSAAKARSKSFLKSTRELISSNSGNRETEILQSIGRWSGPYARIDRIRSAARYTPQRFEHRPTHPHPHPHKAEILVWADGSRYRVRVTCPICC